MRPGRAGLGATALALLLLLGASGARAEIRLQTPPEAGLGEPFVAVLVSDEAFSLTVFHWLDSDIPAQAERTAGGWRAEALLGTDVGRDKPGLREVRAAATVGGRRTVRTAQVRIAARDYPEQALTLPEGMVSPSARDSERIARDRTETEQALATLTERRGWRLPLARPTQGEVGSQYGLRRVLNGKPRSPHRGVDFRAAEGQSVQSVADGTVVLRADHFYAGQCVYVDHGQGVVSAYFHLSRALVVEGQEVARGEAVGLAGATGRATGPHLHFALCLRGRCVDPLPLFEGGGEVQGD